MKTVAFIPARGGSKRLPRKNIALFAGKPLIYYSIALAKSFPQVERCVVSTEDDEIAAIALSLGAEVIRRPMELAADTAPTASAARHVLQTLAGEQYFPDAFITLQPTCPLRPHELLLQAIELFYSHHPDSVLTVSRNHHKLGEIKQDFFAPYYLPGTRSQDMPSTFYENGLIYVTKPSLIMENEDLFGQRMFPLLTEPLYSMGDIDSALDFEIAEFLFQKYRQHFAYAEEGARI